MIMIVSRVALQSGMPPCIPILTRKYFYFYYCNNPLLAGSAAYSKTMTYAEDLRTLLLTKPFTVEELFTIPARCLYPLVLWLGPEGSRILNYQRYPSYGWISLVLETFQCHLIRQSKVSTLIPETLHQQKIEHEYMTMEKANEIVEQIEDSNKESVRSCLNDMLLRREEKITMALVKIGLRNTAEELKGQH